MKNILGKPAEMDKVYLFSNGMVCVFDKSGEQITQYQGRKESVLPRILRDAPENVTYWSCNFGVTKAEQIDKPEAL